MSLTRITVNLTERTDGDLKAVAELEQRNKSTVINRSVQVYRRLVEIQHAGGAVVLEHPDGRTERVLFT